MTVLLPPYHTPLSTSNDANLLCATVLKKRGGYYIKVTHFILDEYRAFQRCFRASLGGIVVFIGSMT